MQKGPVTPKGFGDIMPAEAAKRRFMINAIVPVLEKNGFVPLETPTIEFAETLLGKYGEDEKLVYTFEDKGGRKLALRYDLTVPLARFVANNLGLLNPTFARYQIGQVFRGENPQKGRKREFTQFDFDIVGGSASGFDEDATVIIAAIKSARAIKLDQAILLINDRSVFKGLKVEFVRAIDKLSKIGKQGVIDEMVAKGADRLWATNFINSFDKTKPTPNIISIFNKLKASNLEEGKDFEFDPTLARGLDYYTSTVMELKLDRTPGGLSIGGGGRYDNLIGMFAGRSIPAVGFSFGIDRIIDLI